MAILTNRTDVVANFVRYYGRQPSSAQDLATVTYLTTKPPSEVESLLAKNSPVTGGKLWSVYNASKTTISPTQTPVPIPNPSVIKDYTVTGRTADGKTLLGIPKTTVPVPPVPTAPGGGGGGTSSTGEKTEAQLAAERQAEADKQQADAINAYIDSLGLDESQKLILRQVAKESFTSGTKIFQPKDIDSLILNATTNAETSTNEYYGIKTSREIEDLKNKMADIRNASALYNQNEQKSYAEKLKDTRDSLRARGLTFSGENTRQLGQAGSLINQQEGLVPQQRRYDIETKTNDFETQARDAGLAAERNLGSQTVNNIQGELGSIADPYHNASGGNLAYGEGVTTPLFQVNQAGTPGYVGTGDLELQRLKDIEIKKQENLKRLTLGYVPNA